MRASGGAHETRRAAERRHSLRWRRLDGGRRLRRQATAATAGNAHAEGVPSQESRGLEVFGEVIKEREGVYGAGKA